MLNRRGTWMKKRCEYILLFSTISLNNLKHYAWDCRNTALKKLSTQRPTCLDGRGSCSMSMAANFRRPFLSAWAATAAYDMPLHNCSWNVEILKSVIVQHTYLYSWFQEETCKIDLKTLSSNISRSAASGIAKEAVIFEHAQCIITTSYKDDVTRKYEPWKQ